MAQLRHSTKKGALELKDESGTGVATSGPSVVPAEIRADVRAAALNGTDGSWADLEAAERAREGFRSRKQRDA